MVKSRSPSCYHQRHHHGKDPHLPTKAERPDSHLIYTQPPNATALGIKLLTCELKGIYEARARRNKGTITVTQFQGFGA